MTSKTANKWWPVTVPVYVCALVACGGNPGGHDEDTSLDLPGDEGQEPDTLEDTPLDEPQDETIDMPEETGDSSEDAPEDETGEDVPADETPDTPGDDAGEPEGWCGDGTVDPALGEECEDLNDTPGDGCENDCTWTCTDDIECEDLDACNGAETCDLFGHMCEPGLPAAEGDECEADGLITTRDICLGTACVLSRCGDSFTDPGNGEACDDGNAVPDDGCEASCRVSGAVPTAYRFVTASIVDPHLYTGVVIWCQDVTNTANNEFQSSLDGYGVNFVDVFRPIDLAAATNPNDFYSDGICTAGVPDACTNDPADTPVASMANNTMDSSTPCLLPDATVLNPAYTDPNTPMGPCFVTDREILPIDMGGVPVILQDARIAAEYASGSPPGTLVTGVIVGFMSTADAMLATFPPDVPLIGGDTLYEHLADGRAAGSACTSISSFTTDDSDLNGTVDGFWFHINFTAELVDWTDA